MNQEYDEHEVERYIERLKQLNSSQRVELYYQLIKGGGSIASEVLLKALYITLPNNPIGYEVTHQLRRLGDKSVIGPLIEILRKDSDAQARSNAARALGKLNEQSAVGPLIQALEDPDEKIRTDSAVALGHLGDKAAVAVEPLLRLLKKTSVEDLSAVVGSLAKLGGSEVFELISQIIDQYDSETEVHSYAIEMLGYLNDERAFNRLIGFSQSGDEEEVVAAVRGLQWAADVRALPILEALRQQDRNFVSIDNTSLSQSVIDAIDWINHHSPLWFRHN